MTWAQHVKNFSMIPVPRMCCVTLSSVVMILRGALRGEECVSQLPLLPQCPALCQKQSHTRLSLKWGADEHRVWNQGLSLSKQGTGQLGDPGASSAVKELGG